MFPCNILPTPHNRLYYKNWCKRRTSSRKKNSSHFQEAKFVSFVPLYANSMVYYGKIAALHFNILHIIYMVNAINVCVFIFFFFINGAAHCVAPHRYWFQRPVGSNNLFKVYILLLRLRHTNTHTERAFSKIDMPQLARNSN